MIRLQISTSDETRSVTLVATTDQASVSFYRRIGFSDEALITSGVPTVNGVAVFTDVRPPEKTLLSYVAVSAAYERSITAQTVMPTSWSLTRPALAGDIRLGDMVFNTVDELGTVWTVSDIEGWWTLPDAEIPNANRSPEEDGSYEEDGRYLARDLTFSGIFLPRSPDLLESARSKLVSTVNAVRRTVSLRVDETPPRRMSVRLAGKTRIDTVRQSGLTEFAFELKASDPIKYGLLPMTQPGNSEAAVAIGAGTSSVGRGYPRGYDTSTDNLREYGTPGTPNQLMVMNEGNYSSPPILRIDGPVTNPRIELAETKQWMEFSIVLQTGEYLEIDVHEKTVLLNGAVSRRGTMTFSSQWFRMQPGLNTIRYTATASPGNVTALTVTAYSAWLG